MLDCTVIFKREQCDLLELVRQKEANNDDFIQGKMGIMATFQTLFQYYTSMLHKDDLEKYAPR